MPGGHLLKALHDAATLSRGIGLKVLALEHQNQLPAARGQQCKHPSHNNVTWHARFASAGKRSMGCCQHGRLTPVEEEDFKACVGNYDFKLVSVAESGPVRG